MDSTVRYMTATRGPSMALAAKHFAIEFGSQRELLARVNELLSSGKRL